MVIRLAGVFILSLMVVSFVTIVVRHATVTHLWPFLVAIIDLSCHCDVLLKQRKGNAIVIEFIIGYFVDLVVRSVDQSTVVRMTKKFQKTYE